MACDNAVASCLPCDDSPILNLSAEAPDLPVYFGVARYRPDIPGNSNFSKLGCDSWCFSTISQEAADACALAQAQDCVTGPGGDGPCTGICTPGDGSSFLFPSVEQACGGTCSDGSTITYILPAGAYRSLISVADANSKAAAICRQRLGQIGNAFCQPITKACFNVDEPSPIEYVHQFPQAGGSPPWSYSIVAGSLPAGMTLEVGGTLHGLVLIGGEFAFTFEAVDMLDGRVQRACTLRIVEITTPVSLPAAALDAEYTTTLAQTAAVAPLSWTVVPGVGEGLPPGLTLNEQTGEISGTPEFDPDAPPDGIYHFRVLLQDEAS